LKFGINEHAAQKWRSASSLQKIQTRACLNTFAGTRTLQPWIFFVPRIAPFLKAWEFVIFNSQLDTIRGLDV
jgi:hypothetical protein